MSNKQRGHRTGRNTRPPARTTSAWVWVAVFLAAIVALGLLARVGAASSAPILQQGKALGKNAFQAGDTGSGGQGQAIDQISCDSGSQVNYHYHAHLSLFVQGQQIALPMAIGIVQPQLKGANGFVDSGNCLYWLHTHDASGIIHIESPIAGPFTLGNFFDIWGEPLTQAGFAGYKGKLYVYVGGKLFHGNVRGLKLTAHEEITLALDKPVKPPSYRWPSGL
ncbi:MAG: hypothetical protein M0Z66_08515 [Thermaerobacter sp.]|nr:hypothetical protein [Thermaerobacter sp.]